VRANRSAPDRQSPAQVQPQLSAQSADEPPVDPDQVLAPSA
jgi:hypothetical protein